MKIVSLEIKRIEIAKFFPKEKEVELKIMFNDGKDNEIPKKVDVLDPQGSAETILADLRKMEKKIHKENDDEKSAIDNFVNIVVKDEDELIRNIVKFIQKISISLEEINKKKDAEGYMEMIRNIKTIKFEN